MTKKMPKMIQKDDLGKNPPPSGKIEKGRKAPSIASMTIKKAWTGKHSKNYVGNDTYPH